MKSHKFLRIFLVACLLTTLTATTVFADSSRESNGPTHTGDEAPPAQKPIQLNDEALEIAADLFDMTTDELSTALEDGTTLEELAKDAGVEVDDLVTAIQEVMPNWNIGFGFGRGDVHMRLNDEALETAADILDISADALRDALQAGTTLEELAETAGVDYEDLMDAIKQIMPQFDNRPGFMNILDNEELLTEVAALLNMSEDDLAAALEDGNTLQELAEAADIDIAELTDIIGPRIGNRAGFTGGVNMIMNNEEALAAVADLLGLTADELTTAMEDGSTLQDLAGEASLDMQAIMDAISDFMPAGDGMPGKGTMPDGDMPGGGPGGQPGQRPSGQAPVAQ